MITPPFGVNLFAAQVAGCGVDKMIRPLSVHRGGSPA